VTLKLCRWPHECMTEAEERALTAQIRRYRPFMITMAGVLGRSNKHLRRELFHAAMVLLWEMGTERIVEAGEDYVKGAIVRRMRKARRTEFRAAGGNRRIGVHLRVA
jgi:hypothetical protein